MYEVMEEVLCEESVCIYYTSRTSLNNQNMIVDVTPRGLHHRLIILNTFHTLQQRSIKDPEINDVR